MKILLLTPFWRPVPGGISRYVSKLRDQLIASNHTVKVVAISGRAEEGVTILRSGNLLLWRTLYKLIERESPEVVHVHGHWSLLLPAIWAKMGQKTGKVIFTFHTATRTQGLRKRAFRALLNRCDFVSAVCADLLAREVRRFRIRAPVAVTYPGADPAPCGKGGSNFRLQLGIGETTPLVVAVSPLQYPRKVAGLMDLLRAIWISGAEGENIHLAVVGDGIYRPQVEALRSRLGLEGRVHIVGSLEDTTDALSAADVVCHISYQDEMPLVVLEAMAIGKPLLCSPIGGVPEVLRNELDGLFAEGGAETVARRLSALIHDRARATQLGESARLRISAAFTWQQAMEQVERLYGLRAPRRVHFSVDVEEDYQLPSPSYRGVTEAVPRLLETFRRAGIPASFFVTADVAKRFPDLLERIRMEGHHVGSHGLSHEAGRLSGRDLERQSHELGLAFSAIRRSMSEPLAFRAPNFRVDARTVYALGQQGIRVDSSVVPGRTVRATREALRLDFRGAPTQAYRMSSIRPAALGLSGVVQVPVAANPLASGSPLGLGYLNLEGPEKALEALARSPSRDVVFLIHPWEAIDYPPDEPHPAWMSRGCTANLSGLRMFIEKVREGSEIVPFPRLLDRVLEPNPRWWSPGPWGDLIPRPRILLVSNVAIPVTGGISTYLFQLKDELTRQGFDVSLIAYPTSLVRWEARRPRNPLRKLAHLSFAASVLLRVLAWRIARRSVIVHSHGASFCLLVSYVARWMGCVGAHTFHSPLNYPSIAIQWFGPRLDALIYVSEETQRLYETVNHLYHDRVAVAPGAVGHSSTDGSRPSDSGNLREVLGVSPNAFVVLFVGRLVRDKGVHTAVAAMARLRRVASNAVLLVAGPPGESEQDLDYLRGLERTIREQGLEAFVRLLGQVSDLDLLRLYRMADCLVVPSMWQEPAPMVVVEAMSEGLPVVASAIGGLPSRVQDGVTGLLFPPGDEKELTDRLARIARDPALRIRLGSEALAWVSRRVSLQALGTLQSGIYQGLWKEKRLP
jgi:glycosyltransferase involved in cell wall biosynthesis